MSGRPRFIRMITWPARHLGSCIGGAFLGGLQASFVVPLTIAYGVMAMYVHHSLTTRRIMVIADGRLAVVREDVVAGSLPVECEVTTFIRPSWTDSLILNSGPIRRESQMKLKTLTAHPVTPRSVSGLSSTPPSSLAWTIWPPRLSIFPAWTITTGSGV